MTELALMGKTKTWICCRRGMMLRNHPLTEPQIIACMNASQRSNSTHLLVRGNCVIFWMLSVLFNSVEKNTNKERIIKLIQMYDCKYTYVNNARCLHFSVQLKRWHHLPAPQTILQGWGFDSQLWDVLCSSVLSCLVVFLRVLRFPPIVI